ncbi:MAG: cytochrome C biogenesis protein [Candidatus Glassbacteria bacterium GWA2_58_10]|uniref:Cytochrome C biogenesis protein n=1 Tax=Candidatus Glassbacteria bacterium GWA2_58_10 TaxID=1817865 RepID=A0A1F5YF13_9BACT|nr:MAG: cytochrome C biogenesis protein [Candidatus Glassbacteria bacterium GWA2_58_10]
MGSVSLLTAFSAGIFSFISPCVLPLIPAYISFVSGISIDELQQAGADRKRQLLRVLASTLIFVLGFSAVFILLGAGASIIGKLLFTYRVWFSRVSGTLIVVLGLHMTGIFRIGFLEYEKRIQVRKNPFGAIGIFLIGAAFAFGWTPCIGPILAAILALAAQEGTVGWGMLMLAVYSAGLGLPFIVTGLALNGFLGVYKKMRKHLRTIEIIAGIFLLAVGLLIFFDMFSILSGLLIQLFPRLTEIG